MSYTIGGSSISLKTDLIRTNSDGSVLVQHGDTSVLCAVIIGDWDDGAGCLPLQVIYQERAYAAGKIPGGFLKREGKSDKEAIISRMIDRALRSSIDSSYKFSIQVICTVLSYDNQYYTDMLSIIGGSVAMQIAGIPCIPVCAYKMSWNGEKWSFGASKDRKHTLTFARCANGLVMLDSYGKPTKRNVISDGINFAQQDTNHILQLCNSFVHDKKSEVKAAPVVEQQNLCVDTSSLLEKMKSCKSIELEKNNFLARWNNKSVGRERWGQIIRAIARNYIIWSGKRFDGRSLQDLRKMSFDTSLIKGTHGSGLYSKEKTQVLASVTFGENEDAQTVDSLDGNYKDKFIFHYIFDPYACGDIRKISVSRREVGHGNLAKRSIRPVMENKRVCRVVADVMSSDGSSSMGSVCASYLAMRDAGINVESVAGISVGLIMEGYKHYLLMDINAQEDLWGDMDFKIAGTRHGLTSIQMDIKVPWVSMNVFEDAMALGMKGVMQIIDMYPEHLKRYQSGDSNSKSTHDDKDLHGKGIVVGDANDGKIKSGKDEFEHGDSRRGESRKHELKKNKSKGSSAKSKNDQVADVLHEGIYAEKRNDVARQDEREHAHGGSKQGSNKRDVGDVSNSKMQPQGSSVVERDGKSKHSDMAGIANAKQKRDFDIANDGRIRFKLHNEMIPLLIGKKGAVVNSISEESEVQIDIDRKTNVVLIAGKRDSIKSALVSIFNIMKGEDKVAFVQVVALNDDKLRVLTFDGEEKNVSWNKEFNVLVGDFVKVTVGRFGRFKEAVENISYHDK